MEEKTYASGIPSESWSIKTQSPRLQRSPCARSWVVFLPIHLLLIKRILLPILYCACLMYIGLINMFNYVIYAFHLASNLCIYDILLEELALCRWREASLESLEKIGVREDQYWINRHKLSKPIYLSILIPFSVKVDCLQV